MTSLLRATIATLALLAASPAQAVERLQALVEADAALAVVARDLPTLLEHWPDSPLGSMLGQREVRHALGDLGQRLSRDYWSYQAEKKLGYSLDELNQALPGGLLLTAPEGDPVFSEAPVYGLVLEAAADQAPALAVAAYLFLGKAAQELQNAPDYVLTEERFFGETLHWRQPREADKAPVLGWALPEGFVVMARSEALLKSLVAAVKDGAARAPWSESAAYARFAALNDDWDLLAYMKGAAAGPLLSGYVRSQRDDNGAGDPQTAQIMAFAEQFAAGFVGDSIGAWFIAGRLEEAVMELDLQVQYAQDTGLMGLLAYRPGPLALPDFAPPDAHQVAVSNFDFAAMWRSARRTLGELELFAAADAMLQAGLTSASAAAGFDVEKTLLASLGTGLVQMQLPRPEPAAGAVTDSLTVISIRDRRALESALESIKASTGWAGMLTRDEYLDTPVYTLSEAALGGGDPAQSPAYAVTDNYLIYASTVAPLHRLLSRLASGRKAETYWENPAVRRLLDSAPKGYAEIVLADGEHSARRLYDALQMIPFSAGPAGANSCRPAPELAPETLSGLFGPALGLTFKDDGIYRTLYRWTEGED